MDEIRNDHGSVLPEAGFSRRTFARTGLGGGLAAALLATVDRRPALAQATPAVDAGVIEENPAEESGPGRYVLTGGETEIIFLPAVAGGPARLAYRDATKSLSFSGEEISVETNGALGQFVWVLIDSVPDGYVQYLTLLVPEVNRDETRLDVPINSLAILTTHWTSIKGPALIEGAIQTYEVVELEGVAEFPPVDGGSSMVGTGPG